MASTQANVLIESGKPVGLTTKRLVKNSTTLVQLHHTKTPFSRTLRRLSTRAEASQSLGRLTQVTLKRPLGLTLAEGNDKRVFVEALVQGGNAEASGKVQVGDILTKSALTD